MIYEFPDPTVPIRQGDIFIGLPRIDLSLEQVLLMDEEGERTVKWEELVNQIELVNIIVPVRSVASIVPGRNTARACLGQRLPMYPPFPVSWQKGARPCITFPQAPLSSRTVGFPESGWQQQRFPRNPSHPIRSLSTRLHSPLE